MVTQIQNLLHASKLTLTLLTLFLLSLTASSQVWSGGAQCQLTVQGDGYVHQEIQTWTLTGTPNQGGAMQVYPATWSASGQGKMQGTQGVQMTAAQWAINVQGMNAPLSIFVRASDRRLVINGYHSPVLAPSGVTGVKQSGTTRTNIIAAANEWRFPTIEAGADDNAVNGSGTVTVSGLPMQSPTVTGTATCQWQFTRNGGASPLPAANSSSSVSPPFPTGATPPPSTPQSTSPGTPSASSNASGSTVPTGPALGNSQPNSASAPSSTIDRTSSSVPSNNQSQSQAMARPTPTPVGKIPSFVDQDTQEYEQATGFVAQVMFQVDQIMDDLTIQQFTAAEWKEIEEQTGGKLVKGEHVFRLPPFPAAGYWLGLGNRRYMISAKGIVNTPTKPSNTSNLQIFVQVGDETPYAVLPSVDFVDSGKQPKSTIFKLIEKLPPSMNRGTDMAALDEHRLDPDAARAHLQTLAYNEAHELCVRDVAQQQRFSNNPILQLIPERCRKRAPCQPGNDKICCLDYDGPYGDGKPINRGVGTDCMAIGAKFFEWSTCFIWTVAGACSNEAALPWNGLNPLVQAPDCYHNHKYRNCQNLDANDFKLNPASTLIKFGQVSDLWLRNNTVGNSTCLTITTKGPMASLDLNSPGKLVNSAYCGGYRADHFSDQARKHYQQIKLRFITPRVAAVKPCKATYKVAASSGGKVSNATIVATNPRCGGWSGTITFQAQRDWDLAEHAGTNFELDAHLTEEMDVNLTIRNSTGISESQAKYTYIRKAYQQQLLQGGALTRILAAKTNIDASAKGGSDVTLDVKLNNKTGEYSVAADYGTPVGNSHGVDTGRNGEFLEYNTPYSGYMPISHFPGMVGKTSDPKHIKGNWSDKVGPPDNAHAWTGGGVVAVSWDLTFTPGPQ